MKSAAKAKTVNTTDIKHYKKRGKNKQKYTKINTHTDHE